MTRFAHKPRFRTAAPASAAWSVALVTTACLAALVVLAAVAAAPAAAGAYVNPAPAEIRAKLNAAAVERLIPPKILYGIAFQESTWRQFDANGDPLIGSDGRGIGIMQVTTIPAGVDAERLKTEIDYNIAVGADILVEKWGYAPSVFPVIGDGDPRCYENWFFAVWAYNGWTRDNVYPYRVWEHIADGRGLWTGLAVTPVPGTWLVNGFPVAPVATPQPQHWWSPTPLPKPVLSAPRAQKRVAAGDRFTVSGTLAPQASRRRALRRAASLALERLELGAPPHGAHDQPRRRRRHPLGRHLRARQDRPLEARRRGARRRRPRRRDLRGGLRHRRPLRARSSVPGGDRGPARQHQADFRRPGRHPGTGT